MQLFWVEFSEIFEKRTQSYHVLKTHFDQKQAPLFVAQKYSRLKSAIF
jgi:hypothetical protein